ncbi:MAG: S8 family serine peptidase [Proteobacteria bacterium]|nr:S8 family serine peptidase [Pseudomonadota bacterium]
MKKLLKLFAALLMLVAFSAQGASVTGVFNNGVVTATITPDASETGANNVYIAAVWQGIAIVRGSTTLNWTVYSGQAFPVAATLTLAAGAPKTVTVADFDLSSLLGLVIYVAYGKSEADFGLPGHVGLVYTVPTPTVTTTTTTTTTTGATTTSTVAPTTTTSTAPTTTTTTTTTTTARSGPEADIVPNDPLFRDQWHLKNTGQAGPDGVPGKAGEDLNVSRAWYFATGTGIQIAVIDDGLDISHEDLNIVAGKSWDYRVNAYGDPSSSASSHGTSCGGLAAAKGNNGIGVTGVAYNAQLVGYNLLSATTGDFGADSVTKDLASNHIYSNSYGAADGTGLLYPSDAAWTQAIDTGTLTGRGGKGAIYTWAAGNGAPVDRSDYDGQANYQGVLAIGSLTDQGKRSSYSEPGSNILVMAFGGESCAEHTTTTTDVSGVPGYNNGTSSANDYVGAPNYTRCMNGTSAATPEASGVVALLLETNPALTWRDVRQILATTARKNDPGNSDWVTNGGGLRVNHNYGYGAIDATAAVKAAQTWKNIAAQKTATASATPATAIPDNGAAVTSTIHLAGSGIGKLEFIDVNLTTDHAEVGDLEINLTSPAGTVSNLSVVHECKKDSATVACGASMARGTRFGIARLIGESADGNWTLSVRDGKAGNTGALASWNIKAYGY